MDAYTQRLKEYIGEPEDGRTDYFNLNIRQCIEKIKEGLKTNFSVNLWTLDMSNEEIGYAVSLLKKEKIVHVFDEVMDAINCFQSEEDMFSFYKKIREESTEEDLQFLREKNYNTPVIKFFEK
jgi:hypothetical protein